ncbi:hypothetical protein [Phytoactinopolyspora mesophila]|uniref:Uncharacterized protein n=1 Tax=Phytoactinopolyspora mesophila TaxID=2650750 RepID=A0A7K3M245_9ACTN|nr:hypothetical protein [Phytoactinopolyspora mesophila]NDL57107.1 hypothetical protein [Phytoactinopolyspora mesophila]
MWTAVIGQRFRVCVPLADDGFPADAEINRALGRPECALVNDIWVLHQRSAVVYQTGLLTSGGEPAALVGLRLPTDNGSLHIQLLPTSWLKADPGQGR